MSSPRLSNRRRSFSPSWSLACAGWLVLAGAVHGEAPRFESDIRPLLRTHCLHCHGEQGEREGGLDLRLRRLIVAGGDSGPAIQPGKPAESLLLARVRSGEMPPGDDKQLSPAELALLEQWVREGAATAQPEPESIGQGPLITEEDRRYWAFLPVARPPVPAAPGADGDRSLTPLDRLVLSRAAAELGAERARFASPTGRAEWLRRATLDLHGLPPAPEEVAAFVDDAAPDAWERVVDRLLAAPGYGERWGRHWLDVSGYADSEGYSDDDQLRPDAFRYRDYVIRSFNDDKPFDQFLVEQLAGDELVTPPYRNLDPTSIERLVATGFLRMAPDGTGSSGVIQPEARNQVVADTLAIVGSAVLGLTLHCAQCHDHRYDPIPQVDYYRLRAVFEPGLDVVQWRPPAARRISLYTDADRARAAEIEREAAAVEQERLQRAEEYITRTLDEELTLVPEEVREPLRAAYRAPAAERTEPQQQLLKEYPSVASINVGSLYLYDRRREERAGKLDGERKRLEQRLSQLAGVAGQEGMSESQQLMAEIERLRRAAEELRASKAADDLQRFADRAAEIRSTKPPEGFVRALTEQAGATPPVTHLFHRGDHEQPRDPVAPGELSVLAAPDQAEIATNDPALPTTGRRLAWARRLTDGRHPLVARVVVNRLWLHHFGRGIVGTPADFGRLGQPPTHPELLDWLAAELVDSGWSIKHVQRLIVLSQVYRQATAELDEVGDDPTGAEGATWYLRFPVRRLEAEAVRDATLAITGRLNRDLYGPPVPVMEDEVGRIVLGIESLDGERKPTKAIDLQGEQYRRSVYVQVRRTRPLSVLAAFDLPEMTPNCAQRDVSTVAPQSLLLMNSDFALESSNDLARRVRTEAGDDPAAQVTRIWQLAYGVAPSEAERVDALEFLSRQRERLAESPDEALAVLCQAVLGSNRFLYSP